MTTVRVNAAALSELVANRTDESQARALMGRLSGAGDEGNTLHDVFADFGYPQQLLFPHMWNMYRRFGIAKAVVDLPVDDGWRETPEILGPDAFISDFERVVDRTELWGRIQGLDKRQRVGRYAGLFMRVKDGKQPSEPLEGSAFGEAALFSIMPLYEDQIRVLENDTNPNSDTFSQPTMYEYNASTPSGRDERNNTRVNIHPSRLIIAAEGADNGSIYGIPALEGCFNSLMDLRKIIGAGGEGFYRNAAQSLVHSLQDTAEIADIEPLLESFNEQSDDFVRNRMRRSLWTPNMNTSTLDSNLVSPKEFFNAAMADVAAASSIPATIIIGQQTGKLASEEDGKRWLRMVQARREGFQTELLKRVVGWMMEHGILPSADYEINWADAMAASDEEKLANATVMSDINLKSFNSGNGSPFAAEEIREAAGFEPDDLTEEGEELPELDEIES